MEAQPTSVLVVGGSLVGLSAAVFPQTCSSSVPDEVVSKSLQASCGAQQNFARMNFASGPSPGCLEMLYEK
jgi:hypothetical protein